MFTDSLGFLDGECNDSAFAKRSPKRSLVISVRLISIPMQLQDLLPTLMILLWVWQDH